MVIGEGDVTKYRRAVAKYRLTVDGSRGGRTHGQGDIHPRDPPEGRGIRGEGGEDVRTAEEG